MIAFSRNDKSYLGQWWWTIDKVTLVSLLLLISVGVLLNVAASPSVALRIGAPKFYFVSHHLSMLPAAFLLILGTSMLPVSRLINMSFLLFIGVLGLMVLTLFIGVDIKGARRWLDVGFFSLQPSEFVKPLFAVVTAWLLAQKNRTQHSLYGVIATLLCVLVLALTLLQPDLGMSIVIAAVFGTQFFMGGLSYLFTAGLIGLGLGGAFAAYLMLPHVQRRIDAFLDPTAGGGLHFQVEKSLNAFRSGGLLGKGPGEGVVKEQIPDVHADFIFAVAGEEYGFFLSLLIILLFTFILLSGFSRLRRESSLLAVLAVAGILTQFGLQALINIGSTMSMIPTKGMTLPFISYGGSSLLALSLGMGVVLALTRKKPGEN